MIGRVRGIVWVTIRQLREKMAQGIEQVEISAGIEVHGSERAGSVRGKDDADTALLRRAAQVVFDGLSNIDDLVFSLGGDCNRDRLHIAIILHFR